MVSLLGGGGSSLFLRVAFCKSQILARVRRNFVRKIIFYICVVPPKIKSKLPRWWKCFFLQFPFCADHATDVTPTGIGKYTPRLSVSTQYRITSINRSVTVRTNARFLPRVPIGRIQRRSTKIKIRSCCAGTSPSIHTSLTKYYYYLLLYPYD